MVALAKRNDTQDRVKEFEEELKQLKNSVAHWNYLLEVSREYTN